MEWILFIVVFLFILGFVMRDPAPKDSDTRRENLSKAASHDRSKCSLPGNIYRDSFPNPDDLMFDPMYSNLSGNVYHDSFHKD
jgi:hypothetical protein